MCVLISSTTFVWTISHPKKKRARHDQKCLFVLECPLFLSDFHEVRLFFTVLFFFENTQISNFMTIRPVRAELYMREERRTDRQTDRHERSLQSVFVILRTRLKTHTRHIRSSRRTVGLKGNVRITFRYRSPTPTFVRTHLYNINNILLYSRAF